MCLLVVASRVIPGTPLLIGANRDEFIDRPSTSFTVLAPSGPRILGGRDERVGGTWLAVNEHGVFAGLTNQPLPDGKDPTRRSRGELPMALAAHAGAPTARPTDFVAPLRPSDYNGSWLLVGDRHALFFIDFTGLVEPVAIPLPPGLHVLENRPLGVPSPKVDHVHPTCWAPWPGDADRDVTTLGARWPIITCRRDARDRAGPMPGLVLRPPRRATGPGPPAWLATTRARHRHPAAMWVADGPPCTAPFVDVSRVMGALHNEALAQGPKATVSPRCSPSRSLSVPIGADHRW